MGKFTTKQFIDAIPGTGGVIEEIRKRVGCDWHTAKRYIEEHPTVKQAYENENNRITDISKNNIIKAIEHGDLAMSKWWLQVKDEEFVPREKREVDQSGELKVMVEYVNTPYQAAELSPCASGDTSEVE